jgi:hypothetical protein
MRMQAAVIALALSLAPAVSRAGVIVSITVAPPILPVYVQPICPEVGFLWTPGYWAYGDAGYFWVPGVWMRPPSVGLLWTPGYWGWSGGVYAWNAGYWGPHVGFYGGVNYGFGYGGVGFLGGRWEGGRFAYNAEVAHVGVGGGWNSYHEHVAVNNVHTAFNGGAGGIHASANAEERRAMAEHHTGPTAAQNSHHEMASHDRGNLASANHGHPANAAMSRPHVAGGGGAGASHAGGGAAKGGENHGGGASKGGPAGASHGASGGASHNTGGASHSASKAPSGGGSKAGGGASKPSGGGGGGGAKAGGGGGGAKGGGGHSGGKK